MENSSYSENIISLWPLENPSSLPDFLRFDAPIPANPPPVLPPEIPLTVSIETL